MIMCTYKSSYKTSPWDTQENNKELAKNVSPFTLKTQYKNQNCSEIDRLSNVRFAIKFSNTVPTETAKNEFRGGVDNMYGAICDTKRGRKQ